MAPKPTKVMYELYLNQKEALDKMHNGCILVGDVGTGKSITGLAYFFEKICSGYFKDGKGFSRVNKDLYIITTARKRDTFEWEEELNKFNLANVNVIVDSWNNIEKYKDIKNSFFIFDEQRLVGYGKWAKTFIKISKFNEWILLSATPGDSWNDYRTIFIANGFFKNKWEFESNHCLFNPYVKYPVVKKYINTDYLIKCQRKILIRMKSIKKTVRHNVRVYTDYDSEKYNIIFKQRWNVYTNEPCKQISEVCYALRRVCNEHPSKILEILRIYSIHKKAIIFYNFNYELDMLRKMCEDNDIPWTEWNGQKHHAILKGDRWLYLVQYTAGAEGWNCIVTDTIIFMSQTYSYKTLEQASGRIDRLNTPFTDLYYYHLSTTSSIDKRIQSSLKLKKEFKERSFITLI